MRLLRVVLNKWLMIDLHQPQWLAALSSRGYSTIPEGKLIMSKDSMKWTPDPGPWIAKVKV